MATAAAPAAAAVPPASPAGKTIGIIAGVVAGLVVLGAGGYFGYRMLFPSESPSRVATSGVPPSTAPAPAPAPEPPKETAPAPLPAAKDSAPMPSTPVTPPDTLAKPATKDATAVGTDSSKASGAAASKMDSSKTPLAKAGNPPGAPGSPPSTAETPRTTAAAAGSSQSQQAAQPDRWQLMREAMARCAGDSFFKRVACEQGVGLQYCEGYWGKVPQCPSGPPAKERGQ